MSINLIRPYYMKKKASENSLSSKLDLNPVFKSALDALENSSKSMFITGRAGTGKSTLLSYFISKTRKKAVVLAPTGVAALNVGGVTVHSFFGFKPGVTIQEAKQIASRAAKEELWKSVDVIIIDEISMVRADLLDCVDIFLRTVLKKKSPFGGLQMVFIGDLYQLPPVVTSGDREHFKQLYDSPYFFASKVMTRSIFEMQVFELEKIYRQHDPVFIDFLNAVRNRTVEEEHLSFINQQVNPEYTLDETGVVYLTTINRTADEINSSRLSLIDSPAFTYDASIKGNFELDVTPAARKLVLKQGAQVMFLVNNPDGLWVNGTIGTVRELDNEYVMVETDDGDMVDVAPYKWTLYRYFYDKKAKTLDKENIGTFTQLPLQLAWAVTIHKSQGKTFDRVIIDLSRGTFAHGQAYVALSRCRTREGIMLTRPMKKGYILTDWKVMNFLTGFQYDLSEEKCSAEQKIKIIRDAIAGKTSLAITYLKPNDQKSKRTVMPSFVGELSYNGRKYIGMEAFCNMRQEIRTFRVDRILEIESAK